ncbi:MAG: hypothetical protein AB7I09_17815 [Planctomycetota bacterium]
MTVPDKPSGRLQKYSLSDAGRAPTYDETRGGTPSPRRAEFWGLSLGTV